MTPGGFPNDAEGVRLREELAASADFGDGYLARLADYHARCPRSVWLDTLCARYALAHGAVDAALEHARAAYDRRKADPALWRLLAECHERRGEFAAAAFFRGLLQRHATEDLPLAAIPEGVPDDWLEQFSLGVTDPRFAGFLHEARSVGAGALDVKGTGLLARFMPTLGVRDGEPRLFAGVHSANGIRNFLGLLVMDHRGDPGLQKEMARHITQELITAQMVREASLAPPAGKAVIVPIAATCATNQQVEFRTASFGARSTLALRLGAWSWYRVDEATRITSPEPMIIGEPVLLGHSPRRRRLVLNLMIDALPWSVIRRRGYVDIPNLMRFFGEGVIFDSHYSVAEYTYPSLATIETGRTMQDTQVMHPEVMTRLSPRARTMAERLRDAGYHCSALATDGTGVHGGVMRGYHRVLANIYTTWAAEGVERVIRELEAFGECDNFILMHTTDVHPANWESVFSLESQVRTPLRDNVLNDTRNVSVALGSMPMNRYQNLQAIRMADNALGRLFDYLESRYRDDECAVHLYSDHGVSVHDDDPWMMSEGRTRAAFMVRGAGVPRLGLVSELTSALDIYPVVLRSAGLAPEPGLPGALPIALGGPGRRCVISNSVYPGQTFKLCIRTMSHEFRLETDSPTRPDCTADLTRFACGVYTRDEAHRPVDDPGLEHGFLALARGYLERNGMLDEAAPATI